MKGLQASAAFAFVQVALSFDTYQSYFSEDSVPSSVTTVRVSTFSRSYFILMELKENSLLELE